MSNYKITISFKTHFLNILRRVFKIRMIENILVKKTQGKEINSFYGKLIPPEYLYKKNTNRIVTRNSIRYHLDLSDVVDHFIFWGLNEESRNKLYSFAKKGMVIMDIGANMGDTALHFSKITGDSGMVIAFEPDIHNFRRATRNISLNEASNVQLHNIGLGDVTATYKLYRVNANNQGMNRILDEALGIPYTEIKVDTADIFTEKNNVLKTGLIKIDVEGFEMKVLRGAIQLLKKDHPVLFIELDDENLKVQNSSACELITFLNTLNYTVRHASTDVIIKSSDDFSNCHYDIYAIHEN